MDMNRVIKVKNVVEKKRMARLCFILLALSVNIVHAEKISMDIDFVPIPAGEFLMGNSDIDATILDLPDGDASLVEDELPAHPVFIGKKFNLSRTEVTQGQWYALMKTRPGPDELWKRPDWKSLPVVSVTWNDTQDFIRKLNQAEHTQRYRLPTEAEWEYAARAGSKDNQPFASSDLPKYAWFLDNSGDMQHPVATRQPNAWGLYDMLGNAWEWVDDRYQADAYLKHDTADPKGNSTGDKRVRRGGSYHCPKHMLRVNYRAADTPDTRYTVIGFRLLQEEK